MPAFRPLPAEDGTVARPDAPFGLDQALAAELDKQRRAHLYRGRHNLDGPQTIQPVIDGTRYLAFCSNDYLGLANDASVVAAARQAAGRYGLGSGASHLVSGHSRAHAALEEELAAFTGRERALLFSTGYMANLGVAAALLGRGDLVCEDRLNHASLVDAAVLSRARMRRYGHGDSGQLRRQLQAEDRPRKLVLTDGVFSMDGDTAPLPELIAVTRASGACLVVDDAHGLGVLGNSGGGTLEHFCAGMDDVPVLMGTLGKAFGTFGAFVAGRSNLIETLIQKARSYIYTTALPPAIAEATRASLRVVQDQPWRRNHLRELITRFRTGAIGLGLPLMDSDSPIQPVLVGESERALAISEALRRRGIFITAIRPPTVPRGSARLRITFSASHERVHVDRLLDALAESMT